MKIHYKRRESISTLCGLTVRDNRHVLTRDFSSVTCQKCKSTNWWRDSPGPRKLETAAPIRMSTQGAEAITKMVEKFQSAKFLLSMNAVRRAIGLPEVCRNCPNNITMMIMKGTGFCSANCKDTYEDLQRWKAWSKDISDQMLSKQDTPLNRKNKETT